MPASKDFSQYFTDYFEKPVVSLGKGIYDIGKATVEQGAEYGAAALGKFEEAGRNIGSSFDSLSILDFGSAYTS